MHSSPHAIHGTYASDEVRFLMRPMALETTDVATKESLIQSGARHYSEMLSEERRPDSRHMGIFFDALATSIDRHAQDVARVAAAIVGRLGPGPVVLCSLVRAGVPLGVSLTKTLRAWGVEVHHYGVSIVRGKGLDAEAMARVRAAHGWDRVVFVDGWTGKGAITTELETAWRAMANQDPILAVLADPCGRATIQGSFEDWLIPGGILGANVSGLVSRSIVPKGEESRLHGFVPVPHLADLDVSRAYATIVADATLRAAPSLGNAQALGPAVGSAAAIAADAQRTIDAIQKGAGVTDRNRIKPGIAEATRAVLRRKPDRVLVRNADDPCLAGLRHLCADAGVPVETVGAATGPWRAITLIASVAP